MFHRRASVKEVSMPVIDQALGVLAERFGVDIEAAESIFREAVRRHEMSEQELAACVVASCTNDCAVLPRMLYALDAA
jgi:hypothetical protein